MYRHVLLVMIEKQNKSFLKKCWDKQPRLVSLPTCTFFKISFSPPKMKIDSHQQKQEKSSESLIFFNFLPGDTFLRTEMMVLTALPFRELIPLSAR